MILYFKQAWNLIKQEKLFSSLYIIGTGLSITIVMVLSIVYYIKIANIYPETDRDRMLVIKSGIENSDKDGLSRGQLSLNVIETCFRSLQEAEAVSAVYTPYGKEHYVQPEGKKEQLPVAVKYVDNAFWTVFSFRFLYGKPFTDADFQSGIHTTVISGSLAKQLFGTTNVIGNSISLNFIPYRICGVVKDVSFVTGNSYAQLWIPYTTDPEHKDFFAYGGTLGNMNAYILAPAKNHLDKIRNQAIENIDKFNQTMQDDIEFSVLGQPDRYWQSVFRTYSSQEVNFNKIVWEYLLIFLVLLLVPGISLSGMTDSRMERRLSEMGLRRVFGAPVNTLMQQIITENFLFTFFGGIIGLLFSYLFLLVSSDWIMGIGETWGNEPPEGTIVAFTPAMMMNIPVFLIALGVCFLLNLLTAIIPAWRASHRNIIYSLNAK